MVCSCTCAFRVDIITVHTRILEYCLPECGKFLLVGSRLYDVPASLGVLSPYFPYFPHGPAKSFLIGKFAR